MTEPKVIIVRNEDRLLSDIEIEIMPRFVEFNKTRLSAFYFLDDNDKDNPISMNNRAFTKIEDALNTIKTKKSQWTIEDVFKILAWKTGNINHKATKDLYDKTNNLSFEYKNGWSFNSEEDLALKIYRNNITDINSFKGFANKIIELRENYINSVENANDIWDEIVDYCLDKDELKGIGPVYMITLLYFITKGEYPIFDRYAMAALAVLELKENGINIARGSTIRIYNLPDKRDEKLKDLLDSQSIYGHYCEMLEKLFPNKQWRNRKVDQALWVYGHYFVPEYV